MNPDRAKAARELLAFYMEAGVDSVVGEEPVNRFADAAAILSSRGSGRAVGAEGQDDRVAANQAQPSPAQSLSRAPVRGAEPALRAEGGVPHDPLGRAAGRSSGASGGAQFGAVPAATPQAAPLSPDAAVMAAREAARSAANLDQLRDILAGFEGCALKNTATKLVFADGNPQAPLMFVGEAPGREEDLAGLPFVGRSGKLLDRMLAAIGRDRTSAYIANIVPWRPPGNRKPTPQEAAICLPFLLRQIELADPDVLVCLGDSAAQTILETREGITRTRGRWFAYHTGGREIRALATFHPAYLLRTPISKRFAWRDFLAIKKALAD